MKDPVGGELAPRDVVRRFSSDLAPVVIDERLRPITHEPAILGECLVWWPERNEVLWVDIRGQQIHALDIGASSLTTWATSAMTGGICLTDDNRVLVALESEARLLDLDLARFEASWPVPRWSPNMRFNEVRCDPTGYVWAGYMNDATRAPVGWLFRMDAGEYVEALDGIAVPNSVAWSPDGSTMYFANGSDSTIWRYDVDIPSGRLSNRRPFVELSLGSIPDGATVDSAGYLWSADYGSWAVTRYDPDGRVDQVIEMPVSQPTSCALGGEDLDILFITTAHQRLSAQELRRQPLAGHTFATRVATPGLPTPRASRDSLGDVGYPRTGDEKAS